jgi:hypothetical protein
VKGKEVFILLLMDIEMKKEEVKMIRYEKSKNEEKPELNMYFI